MPASGPGSPPGSGPAASRKSLECSTRPPASVAPLSLRRAKASAFRPRRLPVWEHLRQSSGCVTWPSRASARPSRAASAASGQMPKPAASPMAAASHITAPVVRFFTLPRREHDHAGGEEGDARGGGLDQADGVHADDVAASGVELDDVQGDQREAGRGEADDHVGAQPGGAVGRLALEPDHAAEQRRAHQPERDDRQRQHQATERVRRRACRSPQRNARGRPSVPGAAGAACHMFQPQADRWHCVPVDAGGPEADAACCDR